MSIMQAGRKRRRRYAAPIGGLFIALAIIGVIAVVVTSIDLTGKVLDNSNEKEKIGTLIRPVVMFDPVPFETPTDLENRQLLLYSMWANLGSEKRNTYSYDENAELIVPASDLEVAAANLFGPDIVLTHETFGDYQTTYYYDEERNIYNVPVSAQLYVYTPQVESIELASRDVYNVKVGYIPPQGDAWTTDFSGNKNQPTAEKSMIYVMQKTRNGYYILALRDLPSASLIEVPVEDQSEGTVSGDM